MNTSRIIKLAAAGLIGLSIIMTSSVQADGGGAKYKESPLNPVYKMIKAKQYEKAIARLNKADQKNADVLNLLGFSNRKLKNYDEALTYYQQALSINPKHKGANEYLGELYLETGKLDEAQERLAILDDACFFSCSEYNTLKNSIEAYKNKNSL